MVTELECVLDPTRGIFGASSEPIDDGIVELKGGAVNDNRLIEVVDGNRTLVVGLAITIDPGTSGEEPDDDIDAALDEEVTTIVRTVELVEVTVAARQVIGSGCDDMSCKVVHHCRSRRVLSSPRLAPQTNLTRENLCRNLSRVCHDIELRFLDPVPALLSAPLILTRSLFIYLSRLYSTSFFFFFPG